MFIGNTDVYRLRYANLIQRSRQFWIDATSHTASARRTDGCFSRIQTRLSVCQMGHRRFTSLIQRLCSQKRGIFCGPDVDILFLVCVQVGDTRLSPVPAIVLGISPTKSNRCILHHVRGKRDIYHCGKYTLYLCMTGGLLPDKPRDSESSPSGRRTWTHHTLHPHDVQAVWRSKPWTRLRKFQLA